MQRDPEGNELRYLLRYAALDGRRVLDIGCGDGLLTCRFAPQATAVVAVDPSVPELREARSGRSQTLERRVHFAAARGQALPVAAGHYDLAFFTSSF
jgi:2-polyprenyl-3-methyl-5-hydroxy-6-metoxy-1,4-benzoquinol methylase